MAGICLLLLSLACHFLAESDTDHLRLQLLIRGHPFAHLERGLPYAGVVSQYRVIADDRVIGYVDMSSSVVLFGDQRSGFGIGTVVEVILLLMQPVFIVLGVVALIFGLAGTAPQGLRGFPVMSKKEI